MKKVIAVVFFSMVVSMVSYAQETPVVNKRQHHQHARIRHGIASGTLTHREAVRLRHEQRHIRRTERRVKSDGVVTASERTRLERKQNRASRDIRRQKLN